MQDVVVIWSLVAVMVVSIGLSHWGLGRLKRGDEGGGRLMMVVGPPNMLAAMAVVLAAVFSFN